MSSLFSLYLRFVGLLVGVGEFVVAVMCLHIVAEIVANAVFASPIEGTPEIVARWYMVAIVFLPLALIHHRGDHISADLFTSRLGPRAQAGLDLVIQFAMVAMAATLAWFTFGEAWDATLRNERIELVSGAVPVWPARWLVPLGFATMAVVALLLAPRRLLELGGRRHMAARDSTVGSDRDGDGEPKP